MSRGWSSLSHLVQRTPTPTAGRSGTSESKPQTCFVCRKGGHAIPMEGVGHFFQRRLFLKSAVDFFKNAALQGELTIGKPFQDSGTDQKLQEHQSALTKLAAPQAFYYLYWGSSTFGEIA